MGDDGAGAPPGGEHRRRHVQFLDTPGERSRALADTDEEEAGATDGGELVGVGAGASEDDLVF